MVILVAGCSDSGGKQVTAKRPTPPSAVPTALIVDASGSMTEADAPGPRMDAAKQAAQGLVDGMPNGTAMSLLTYGTSTGSADAEKTAGCQDVKVLIPLGPLDRAQMQTRIAALTASGYTPISLALQTAAAQLPAGAKQSAIVLVSDGEDTCDTPPCDTAGQLKQSRPNLTVSTVGFKTAGAASDQLRCIATATGGIFVQADNANQLAARLLATRNLDEAQNSLANNGFGDIELGSSLADIRRAHTDFPDASTSGSVRVVYRDCDFGFVDGVLDSIEPHGGGRTIDGVVPGTPLSRVVELYGDPVATESDGQGEYRLIYRADPDTDAGYRMTAQDYSESGGTVSGTVKTIVLCRCAPHAGPAAQGGTGGEPETVVLKPVDARGSTTAGYLKDSSMRDTPIDCSGGFPSRHDVTRGVRECGASVDTGDACWPTAGSAYVLCLVDPFKNVLMLRAATGATDALRAPLGPPTPIGLELDDGTQCRSRVGGSWSSPVQQPDWVGFYSCSGGRADYFPAIWAPAGSSDGIERGMNGWTVHIGDSREPLATRSVTKIYLVGVA
ncbi:VWA domain-containing protein [Mycobacterium sp. M1]|uniref:VWA domain-containing protein n=2 Tax=Mycolicibacter acidiphilus TaxID=2835306 RepID=A0ABS5RNI6_9MYCO|nr:VWA domain-containing protein [Mycolicibacter acidiphilus]